MGSDVVVVDGLRKLGFEKNPLSEAAYEALRNQGQTLTRSSLRALVRDLGELEAASGGEAKGSSLRALAGLLAAARTAGLEVDPASLIRAAKLGTVEQGFGGWEILLGGLRAAGFEEEARKLERFQWKFEGLGADSLRAAVEESGAFAEARLREGKVPPEDLKFELLKLREKLSRARGIGQTTGLVALVETILNRIRELQRSFDLAPGHFRIRAELPGERGMALGLAVTGRRAAGESPVSGSASFRLSSGAGVRAELLVNGNRVEAELTVEGDLGGKLASRKEELERALRAKGLEVDRIRVSPGEA